MIVYLFFGLVLIGTLIAGIGTQNGWWYCGSFAALIALATFDIWKGRNR